MLRVCITETRESRVKDGLHLMDGTSSYTNDLDRPCVAGTCALIAQVGGVKRRVDCDAWRSVRDAPLEEDAE